MSVHIVAFGNERDEFSEDDQQKSLIWTYLGRSALVSETDNNLLLNSASYLRNPAFTEYQACVFGNVRLVVHDCPLWDIFESDWYTSRNLIGEADIIVIKYSVNDKSSFQEVKDIYAPLIKKTLSHCSVPVIISAVGARQNASPWSHDQNSDAWQLVHIYDGCSVLRSRDPFCELLTSKINGEGRFT